ncbi:MAG: circadian clock KaiB family protein [Burkholderiaceae bacterium]|nr:circadian clock KaiB family protein [Burkholderiaceae bacterium]MDO9090950.1 circadian clock KaiB family protein [Burkholderiaceae bacterium]
MTPPPSFKFRLFVAGGTPNSVQALGNLKSFCQSHLANLYEIEVVDVFREPLRALSEGIFMTPTLLKLGPGAAVRIVGTLSDSRVLLQNLGAEANAA